ncbi:hypothetical protein TrST_g12309 [Triparma strigata]|uniref:Uncharacterized protein n=1 Tax=Triparma strigata TaxID=1606541 RepID=A0A9W7EGN9_9STRA|nr:hypothetical protein TrST_g12309 [Triparma strigata]
MPYSIKGGAKYHDFQSHSAVPKPMPVVNKIIQQKLLARQKRLDKKMVKAVKAVVDNKPPVGFYGHQFNAKKRMLQEDREYEIEKANTHLVDRMVNIAQSNGTIDSRLTIDPSFHVPVSMNLRKRVDEIERIERENYLNKQRIAQVKGSYAQGAKKKKGGKGGKAPESVNAKPTGPTRPSAMSPSPGPGSRGGGGGRPRRVNYTPLFTIGTRLGELHVKMNIYDKRDGSVRINIYEPLSSKQYPMDLDYDTMSLIVGPADAGLMTEKSADAKTMWKEFANKLTLKPIEGSPNTYELVVENDMEEGAFPIVETQFEFADPTAVHNPDEHDAAGKIQARFRGSSARKLVDEEKVRKKEMAKLGKGAKRKKGGKKSPEKRAAERAEIEMIKTYDAQAVIAKHMKGHLARKQVVVLKEERGRKRAESEDGATKIQSVFRAKKAEAEVQEKKEQKEASVKIQGIMRKKKAKEVVKEKKEQKEASVKIQGIMRKKKAKEVVKEKKEQKEASVKIQGIIRKKKAKAVVQEKKQQKDAAVKVQSLARKRLASKEVEERKTTVVKAEASTSDKLKEEAEAKAKAEAEAKAAAELKLKEEAEAKAKAEAEAKAVAELKLKEEAEAKAKAEAEAKAKAEAEAKAAAELKLKEEAEAKAKAEADAKAKAEAEAKAKEEAEAKAKAVAEAQLATEEKKSSEYPGLEADLMNKAEVAAAVEDLTAKTEVKDVLDEVKGIMEGGKITHKVAEGVVDEIMRAGTPTKM